MSSTDTDTDTVDGARTASTSDAAGAERVSSSPSESVAADDASNAEQPPVKMGPAAARLARMAAGRGKPPPTAPLKSKHVPVWLRLLVMFTVPIMGFLVAAWLLLTGSATFDGSRFGRLAPPILLGIGAAYVTFEMLKLRLGPKGKDLPRWLSVMTLVLPMVAIVAFVLVAMPEEWWTALHNLLTGGGDNPPANTGSG